MEQAMELDNFSKLRKTDVIKFVVGSETDLDAAKKLIIDYDLQDKVNIFFSPVFGEIEPKEIVEYVLKNHMDYARVQLQLHKFIWEPDKRGV
jgi:7-carboxy-7-deazaguanine synthase